jgi:hypothetical protein
MKIQTAISLVTLSSRIIANAALLLRENEHVTTDTDQSARNCSTFKIKTTVHPGPPYQFDYSAQRFNDLYLTHALPGGRDSTNAAMLLKITNDLWCFDGYHISEAKYGVPADFTKGLSLHKSTDGAWHSVWVTGSQKPNLNVVGRYENDGWELKAIADPPVLWRMPIEQGPDAIKWRGFLGQ